LRKALSQSNDVISGNSPSAAVVDDKIGLARLRSKIHLSSNRKGRLAPRNAIPPHYSAALRASPGIYHKNCINLFLPSSLIQQWNFDDQQRSAPAKDFQPHRFKSQRMQQSIHLPTDITILKDSFAETDTIDLAVR